MKSTTSRPSSTGCDSGGDAPPSARVLVTGGAGYLGSILVPELLRIGCRVTVMDNLMFRQTPLLDCCTEPAFRIIRGDARDETLLREHLSGADWIIPLAALVGAPLCQRDPAGARSTNRDAVVSLVRLASREQRIILPSTNSGYGIGREGLHCDEETPLRPVSLYGQTKVEAERAVLDRGNCVTLRLATLFGLSPRMRLDLLVNDLTFRALRDGCAVIYQGHFMRNFLHVRDAARAFVHAMRKFEDMRDRPYNVGLSDANLSKMDLCARIKKQVPHFLYLEAPVGEDPDQRDYIVSNARIEATGYRPRYSLDEGIAELIRGYPLLANGVCGNV